MAFKQSVTFENYRKVLNNFKFPEYAEENQVNLFKADYSPALFSCYRLFCIFEQLTVPKEINIQKIL